jgi:hypothetical protein
MPQAIQSIFQKQKPAKSGVKFLGKDNELDGTFFNNVSKSHYLKRKKLKRAKQLDEAIKGFFIAAIFLIFGTLLVMFLNNNF